MSDHAIPTGTNLSSDQVDFLNAFSKDCRRTMLGMLNTSQSGHPGGSLSCLDYLAVLYAYRLTNTDEKIVVSNGHISPGVYSVLAQTGAIDKQEVIDTFRQKGSIYEGHVTRHIAGIHFGTGPLGVGTSAAAGYAKSNKLKGNEEQVFFLMGDGEAQEGQVHEMALFANKEKLDNLIGFCDYNRVQLTDSLEATVPIDVSAIFKAHNWNVIDIDGHDHQAIWTAINEAIASDKPTMIVGQTIMGYGVPMMEPDGRADKASWHGKAPKPEQIFEQLATPELTLSEDEVSVLADFVSDRGFKPAPTSFVKNLEKDASFNTGTPIVYAAGTKEACRAAYGAALLDLAKNNNNVIAGTADVGGSVMTKFVKADLPAQHIEFGICEQNMVSVAGPLSLEGYVPFVSTFGAFMSSRAKDQARVNDINATNVKMVSTHCGLSVGEDGPTHQAIDDMGSFMGMFNTQVLEPADANHCDRLIRYTASHYGNFYVRMGRHGLPVLEKSDGTELFGADYEYRYGRTDTLKEGSTLTLVASGPMVSLAQAAVEATGVDAEIVIASSPKAFDDNLKASLAKTGKVLIVEDHNGLSGFASQVAMFAAQNNVAINQFAEISPKEYQLSGSPMELYETANVGQEAIEKALAQF